MDESGLTSGAKSSEAASARPPERLRGSRAGQWEIVLGRIAVAAGVLIVWQVLATRRLIDPFFVSRPSAIAGRVWEWMASGFIWRHLAVTLEEAVLAFVIGTVLGIGAGFVLARGRRASLIFNPYLRVLNALPRVVLAPLFLLWFGLGIWSKVALGVTLVFFVVFFNTYQGVRDVDRVLVDNARVLGASEAALIRHVFGPSALTWIFSSLQTSIGFAIVGAVVGEYLGASRGIGYVISQAEGTFDTTGVFAGLAVLSVCVVIVGEAVARLERRLLAWKR
ncbi:MAG TPA: ABC transporter permease [Vicinamibacterales bacterium]|jgi:NitT/TauT family transport system permease protein